MTEFDPWTLMMKQKDAQTSTHRPWQAQIPPLTKWINYKFNAVPFVKQLLCTFAGTQKKQITTRLPRTPRESQTPGKKKLARGKLIQKERCSDINAAWNGLRGVSQTASQAGFEWSRYQHRTAQSWALPAPYPIIPVWSRGSWPRDREPCLWCLPLSESRLILHSTCWLPIFTSLWFLLKPALQQAPEEKGPCAHLLWWLSWHQEGREGTEN